jgi:hypothetical protein
LNAASVDLLECGADRFQESTPSTERAWNGALQDERPNPNPSMLRDYGSAIEAPPDERGGQIGGA